MYLLQSGAYIDLSTIPFPNLVVVVTAFLLVAGAAMYIIARHVKKIGPIDLSKEHSGQTALYNMNRENDNHDNELKMRIRAITLQRKTRLRNILKEFHTCPLAMMSLTGSLLGPLYASVINNHLTTVLQNRAVFSENLLMAMEDEYEAVRLALFGNRCDNKETLPKWESIKEKMRKFVDEWTENVLMETIKTCEKKLVVYREYKPQFAKDSYRSGIVDSGIAKNENYIQLFKSMLRVGRSAA